MTAFALSFVSAKKGELRMGLFKPDESRLTVKEKFTEKWYFGGGYALINDKVSEYRAVGCRWVYLENFELLPRGIDKLHLVLLIERDCCFIVTLEDSDWIKIDFSVAQRRA